MREKVIRSCPPHRFVEPADKKLFLRIQLQRYGVDAVAESRWTRTVREDVAQMCAAFAAHDLGALHAVGVVFFGFHVFLNDGLEEAGPTGAGFKLRIGIEQFVAAGRAFVYARLLGLVVLAGERTFGALHAADLVLFGRQFFLPFFFGFLNFVLHEVIVMPF